MNVTANECYRRGYAGYYLTTNKDVAVARFTDAKAADAECVRRNLARGARLDSPQALALSVIPAYSPTEGTHDE